MGIARGWEKRVIRTNITYANRTVRIFSVSPQSRSLFSASFQTFCLTARAYLNTQKYGLFCSLLQHLIFFVYWLVLEQKGTGRAAESGVGGGGKVCLRKSVVQSACQYDVTSRVSDFQNGEHSLRTADVSPRSSPLRDVSRGGTSATQRQKFHTDDVNQCLHYKFGSHGVPNANLFNFTFPLVDFGKVLCSSVNELQQNSNASSREDYTPQILAVLLESDRVYN